MATTTPNFGWPVPTSTDLVKDGATAIEALGDSIDASLLDLKGGTTGQLLSKASGTDMDFTWTSPNPGDITAVTAGTGISGGGTSGDVTITNSMATAIDAKGDLIAGTGADAFARLAVGNNGETLIPDSTASTGLKWAKSSNFVGCTLFDTGATQAIANNTATALTFNAETIDTDGFHSTSTNTSRMTIPTGLSGKFLITINTLWDLNGVGIRNFNVRKNGATFYAPQEIIGSTTAYVGQSGSAILEAVAGDYFELFVLQTSGAGLTLYKRESDRPFNLQFLGA